LKWDKETVGKKELKWSRNVLWKRIKSDLRGERKVTSKVRKRENIWNREKVRKQRSRINSYECTTKTGH
jgi:hypothetical protein